MFRNELSFNTPFLTKDSNAKWMLRGSITLPLWARYFRKNVWPRHQLHSWYTILVFFFIGIKKKNKEINACLFVWWICVFHQICKLLHERGELSEMFLPMVPRLRTRRHGITMTKPNPSSSSSSLLSTRIPSRITQWPETAMKVPLLLQKNWWSVPSSSPLPSLNEASVSSIPSSSSSSSAAPGVVSTEPDHDRESTQLFHVHEFSSPSGDLSYVCLLPWPNIGLGRWGSWTVNVYQWSKCNPFQSSRNQHKRFQNKWNSCTAELFDWPTPRSIPKKKIIFSFSLSLYLSFCCSLDWNGRTFPHESFFICISGTTTCNISLSLLFSSPSTKKKNSVQIGILEKGKMFFDCTHKVIVCPQESRHGRKTLHNRCRVLLSVLLRFFWFFIVCNIDRPLKLWPLERPIPKAVVIDERHAQKGPSKKKDRSFHSVKVYEWNVEVRVEKLMLILCSLVLCRSTIKVVGPFNTDSETWSRLWTSPSACRKHPVNRHHLGHETIQKQNKFNLYTLFEKLYLYTLFEKLCYEQLMCTCNNKQHDDNKTDKKAIRANQQCIHNACMCRVESSHFYWLPPPWLFPRWKIQFLLFWFCHTWCQWSRVAFW